MSAFPYYINRLITLPITEESKQLEWQTILAVAKSNGYPAKTIGNLRNKLLARKQTTRPKPGNN